MRLWKAIPACLLLLAPAVHAYDSNTGFLGSANVTDRWQKTTADMQPYEYHASARHNKYLLLGTLLTYSKNALVRLGPTSAGILVHAPDIELADWGSRFTLNNSHSFGLVLKNTTGSNRSLLLEFRKVW
jgi:hypothetical protein